jgi:hypothetical protein
MTSQGMKMHPSTVRITAFHNEALASPWEADRSEGFHHHKRFELPREIGPLKKALYRN